MLEIEKVYEILKRITACIKCGDYDAAREYADHEMKNIEKKIEIKEGALK